MSKKWPIFAYNSTDRLREKRTRGGEGVQNPENFAYVLNGCSVTIHATERGRRADQSYIAEICREWYSRSCTSFLPLSHPRI